MSLPQPAPATGNRFTWVTPDNNDAPLIIVTILSLIFSCLIFAVRIFAVKWKNHGLDDSILGWAHIIGVGQWAAIFLGLHNGLGKSFDIVEDHLLIRMSKAVFASRILLMIVLSLSKLSVLFVIRSLFTWEKRQKIFLIDCSIAISALWGVVSTLVLSAGCSPTYILSPTTSCPNHVLKLQMVTALDIITECMIVSLPIILLWRMHMSRQKKRLVITAFVFRLPLAIISILYLLATTRFLSSHPTQPGTNLVPTILWQEILIGYSLMSATIPCLKSFVRGFTHGGVGYLQNATYGDDRYQSGSGRSGESFVMVGLKKKRSAIEAGIEITATENTLPRTHPTEYMPMEGSSVRSHITHETHESQRDIIGEAV